ncbi:MAG TPA: hydroxymethylbilane synthase [Syntrophomonadaceae bacterium]|nr:hydroxymethylbilane synthase [Syntrophomonadaceae bacterium]
MKKIRLGTRGSNLALWQAEYVAKQIKLLTNLQVEIKVIKTKGDKILDVALSKIGDKGLFTKEIENQLLQDEIDIAIHSLKDLPSDTTPGLIIGAVLEREKPQDVLITRNNLTFDELLPGSRIGTSSLRRIAQLKALRPDIITVDIRGNIETRIRRMKEQELDGIILAYAGVKRLQLDEYIGEVIINDKIMPAVGQGAIAVEARKSDGETLEILKQINHKPTYIAITAERAFQKELEGGCQVPMGANAVIKENRLYIEGLVASLDGKTLLKSSVAGDIDQANELGVLLARDLIDKGALSILEDIKKLGE